MGSSNILTDWRALKKKFFLKANFLFSLIQTSLQPNPEEKEDEYGGIATDAWQQQQRQIAEDAEV